MTDISLRQHSLDGFSDTIQQFIGAISGVFPECIETKKCKYKFEIAITHSPEDMSNKHKTMLIKQWHKTMEPLYDRCKQRDITVIQEICETSTFASELQLWSKWNDPEIQEDTHEVIWTYIDNLNKFCQMFTLYDNVPEKMMTSIQSMAASMATGQKGPEDMLKMGQKHRAAGRRNGDA